MDYGNYVKWRIATGKQLSPRVTGARGFGFIMDKLFSVNIQAEILEIERYNFLRDGLTSTRGQENEISL